MYERTIREIKKTLYKTVGKNTVHAGAVGRRGHGHRDTFEQQTIDLHRE